MAHLIDKDALVAEIKRRMDENSEKQVLPQYFGMVEEDLSILSFLDTLEVKEVDLEKEIEQSFINLDYHLDEYNRAEDYVGENIDMVEYERIAKHFFELGLKAQKGE